MGEKKIQRRQQLGKFHAEERQKTANILVNAAICVPQNRIGVLSENTGKTHAIKGYATSLPPP